jgi:hypothetical protein
MLVNIVPVAPGIFDQGPEAEVAVCHCIVPVFPDKDKGLGLEP